MKTQIIIAQQAPEIPINKIVLPQIGADAVFAVLSGAMVGLFAFLVRQLMVAYGGRFQKLEQDIAHQDAKILEQEREILRLRAELPVTYLRNEDFLRFGNAIDAKLDHLNRKMDGFLEARIK